MEEKKKKIITKKRVVIFSISTILIIILSVIYLLNHKPTLMQEGDPRRFFGAFAQLIYKSHVDVSDILTEDSRKTTYITKKWYIDGFIKYVEKKYDVKYVDRMGAAYFFRGETCDIGFEVRTYMKFYTLWETMGPEVH